MLQTYSYFYFYLQFQLRQAKVVESDLTEADYRIAKT